MRLGSSIHTLAYNGIFSGLGLCFQYVFYLFPICILQKKKKKGNDDPVLLTFHDVHNLLGCFDYAKLVIKCLENT